MNANDNLDQEFSSILLTYKEDDAKRDLIINLNRKITKLSKQAIYAVHRTELDKASEILTECQEEFKNAKAIIDNADNDYSHNLKSSLEEYIEALTYYHFIKDKRIITRKEMPINIRIPYETYLAALCDLAGEIARRCTIAATNADYVYIDRAYEALKILFGHFLKFEFRGMELRKKFEGMKYNLTKIENIRYDISLKGRNN